MGNPDVFSVKYHKLWSSSLTNSDVLNKLVMYSISAEKESRKLIDHIITPIPHINQQTACIVCLNMLLYKKKHALIADIF